MKNRDAKMRERYLNREDDRLLRMAEKAEKQIRQEKETFYKRTDKDREADEVYQRFLEIAKRLEGGEC